MNRCGYVAIKLCIQWQVAGQIWLKGLSLLTSVSFGFCFVFVVTISWMGFKIECIIPNLKQKEEYIVTETFQVVVHRHVDSLFLLLFLKC